MLVNNLIKPNRKYYCLRVNTSLMCKDALSTKICNYFSAALCLSSLKYNWKCTCRQKCLNIEQNDKPTSISNLKSCLRKTAFEICAKKRKERRNIKLLN